MILTDTSIVVVFLRGPTVRLTAIIQTHQAAICGITLAEVYAGARSPADFTRLATALSQFGTVAIPDTIWSQVGRNLSLLRSHGITVPFPDVVIATVAIDNGLELWTYDAHFSLMQTVLPGLNLFQGPP